jgi:hypothetical protein
MHFASFFPSTDRLRGFEMPMRHLAIALVSLALLAMQTDMCAAQDRAGSAPPRAASAKSSLPKDYRLRIANYVSARNRYVVRDAKITAPYERWGGLLHGGTITCLCVAVFRDNPFGIVVRDNWVFDFDGDRVRPVALGMERCEPLTPFPELMKALAVRR